MQKSQHESFLIKLTPNRCCSDTFLLGVISHSRHICNQESETHQEVPEGPRAAGQGGLRGRQEIPGKGENGVHVQTQLLQDGVRLQV